MGKIDGKHITGIIGNHILQRSRDGKTIIKMKQIRVQQSQATKKASTVFGNASTLSSAMRADFFALTDKKCPGNLVNRMNTANQTILLHCFDKSNQTYAFGQDSFKNLEGFDLNTNSPLSSYLWVRPYLNLNGNTLTLTIPAFEIPAQLKMPGNANGLEILVALGQYALRKSLNGPRIYKSITLEKSQRQVPEQQISFEVAEGCLCVVALGLQFYEVKNNYRTALNTININPAAIIDAVITPGQFNIEDHPSYGLWKPMIKLKLPASAGQ